MSDTKYYIPLAVDPSPSFTKNDHDLIASAYNEGIPSIKENTFLIMTDPKMALFYYLPKVHKNPTRPPGRPIIAGVNSLTSNLSQYIDHHLQKYVVCLDSYLKDTSSVINEVINIQWQPGYRWVTLDVTALHSNIPHNRGISVVRKYSASDDSNAGRPEIIHT